MKNFLLSGGVVLALSLGFTACKKEKAEPAPAVTPAPIITGVWPTSGLPGSTVTISGRNLTGTAVVAFNGTTSTFIAKSATSVTATVPVGATTGSVTLTASGGPSNGVAFRVIFVPAPVISALSLTSGPEGEDVFISGTNLAAVTAVRFNGTPAAFVLIDSLRIRATVPSGARTGTVTVTTPGGTSTGPTFTVTAPLSMVDFLTRRPWRLITYTVTHTTPPPGVILDDEPQGSFCGWDGGFAHHFEPTGAYRQVEHCFNSGTTYTGTWAFNSSNTRLLTMSPRSLPGGIPILDRQIVSLTGSELTCTYVRVDPHVTYTHRYTYTNIQ